MSYDLGALVGSTRTVTIHDLTLEGWDDTDPARPIATLDVTCSAGTYIRAIARDLGETLGNAAYLGSLVRTASGAFTVADALSIDAVREAAAAGAPALIALLRPIDEGLVAMPEVRISPAERDAVLKGQFVRPAAGIPAGRLRLDDDAERVDDVELRDLGAGQLVVGDDAVVVVIADPHAGRVDGHAGGAAGQDEAQRQPVGIMGRGLVLIGRAGLRVIDG